MQQRVEAKRRNRNGEGPPAWLIGLLGLIIGVAGGLGWAWVIQPIEFENAAPSDLAPGGKRMWVDMTADSYAHEEDLELAQIRLQFFTPEELTALFYEGISEADTKGEMPQSQRRQNLAKALGLDLTNPPSIPTDESVEPVIEDSGMLPTRLLYCGVISLILIVILGGAVVFTRSRQTQTKSKTKTKAPSRKSPSTRNTAQVGLPPEEILPVPDESPEVVFQDVPEPKAERLKDDYGGIDDLFGEIDLGQDSEAEPDLLEFDEPEAAPVSYSDPLDEFITRYNYGDDGYDMSFSIETAQTEFLGECGIGMSETLNRGHPQQATAFEVWLFDKDDIRTVTKVLLSEYASNNEQIRNRLTPKGDLIVAKEGEYIDLETKSLRVRAYIREIEYANGDQPNAYFERLVIELVPQQKL